MKPTAKSIVLELLSAVRDHTASAAALVGAAELLGFAEGNVRVALTRMVADGTLELVGRGLYRLGRGTQALTKQVTSWREMEKRVRKWDGGWVCVHTSPGVERTAARHRTRALMLMGFRELAGPLHVRPDNIEKLPELRERLYALGIESDALVFRGEGFDADTEKYARSLWDRDKLTASYETMLGRIDNWLDAVEELPLRTAAREAFFFGGMVLRMVMFDPRLPEPLVDVGARRAFVDAAIRMDAAGRKLWAELVAAQEEEGLGVH